MVESLRVAKLRVVTTLRAVGLRSQLEAVDAMMRQELDEINAFDQELHLCLVDLNETSRHHAALQMTNAPKPLDRSYSRSEELEDVEQQLQMERVVLQRTRSVRELHAESYRKLQVVHHELRVRLAASVVTCAMLRFYSTRLPPAAAA